MKFKSSTITDWSGGMDTSAGRGELPKNTARRLLNLVFDDVGRLRYPGGRRTVKTVTTYDLLGGRKYTDSAGNRRILYIQKGASEASVNLLNESGGAVQSPAYPAGRAAIPNTPLALSFAQHGDQLFMVDGSDEDLMFLYFDAGTPTLAKAGMDTVTTQSVTSNTTGKTAAPLNSDAGGLYSHVFSFFLGDAAK